MRPFMTISCIVWTGCASRVPDVHTAFACVAEKNSGGYAGNAFEKMQKRGGDAMK